MVKVREDLTGKKFGRLTVLKQVEDHIGKDGVHLAKWLCECDCKDKTRLEILGVSLKKTGGTQSCGCLTKERLHNTLKKYNDMDLYLKDEHGEYGIGYCFNTGNKFYFDMADYNLIKEHCWSEWINSETNYHSLITNIPGISGPVKMTSLLKCKNYDHIDRNPLNNRRYNLRPATTTENARNKSKSTKNTSGIIGVGWYKQRQQWQVRISVNKKLIRIGFYDDKDDAIRARLNAEVKYFGEFAPQKHLFKQYNINITLNN